MRIPNPCKLCPCFKNPTWSLLQGSLLTTLLFILLIMKWVEECRRGTCPVVAGEWGSCGGRVPLPPYRGSYPQSILLDLEHPYLACLYKGQLSFPINEKYINQVKYMGVVISRQDKGLLPLAFPPVRWTMLYHLIVCVSLIISQI